MAVNQAHKAKLTSLGCPDQTADQVLQSLPANTTPAHIEALTQYQSDKSKINWQALPALLAALASQNLPNIIASLQAFLGTAAAAATQQQPSGQQTKSKP